MHQTSGVCSDYKLGSYGLWKDKPCVFFRDFKFLEFLESFNRDSSDRISGRLQELQGLIGLNVE